MRVLLFVFALAGAALAQDLDATNGKPRVLAVRLEAGERLAVDGRLDEPSWQKAVPATDFMQQDPDLGRARAIPGKDAAKALLAHWLRHDETTRERLP